MEVGKTEDEEQEELRRQIHNFENDPSVSIFISNGFHQNYEGILEEKLALIDFQNLTGEALATHIFLQE